MSRTQMLWGVGIVLVLGASAAWQFRGERTAEPQPQSPVASEPTAAEPATPPALNVTGVSVTPASNSAQTSFALVAGESITSWNFRGAYTGNPELTAKAQAEIARLSGLLTTATGTTMILNIGIANQYELLGDGKRQYEYLGRAIQTGTTEGLPWHNLGVLMERLGALKTARIAYEKATLLQPQLEVYHFAYLQFLIQNMKSDTVDIEKAFAAAKKNIGAAPYLAELRAEWQQP